MTGALSAVHMQDFTGDKAGGFQKHHGIDNVLHLAHSPKCMKFGERLRASLADASVPLMRHDLRRLRSSSLVQRCSPCELSVDRIDPQDRSRQGLPARHCPRRRSDPARQHPWPRLLPLTWKKENLCSSTTPTNVSSPSGSPAWPRLSTISNANLTSPRSPSSSGSA